MNVECPKGDVDDVDASSGLYGVAGAANITVDLRGDGFSGLEDSHFIYTQKLAGLTPRDRSVFSTISVSAVGITVTEVTPEEVQELVRPFSGFSVSLENGV